MYKARGRFYQGLVNRGHERSSDPRQWTSHGRSLYRKPQNTESLPEKRETVPIIKPNHVYLVRFKGKTPPLERFLKVGVSSTGLTARFQKDLRYYEIEIIAYSSVVGRDAYQLEQAIHSAFPRDKFRPTLMLATGNTECYRDDEQLCSRLAQIISL